VGRTRSCERLSPWSRSPFWLLWICTRSGRSLSRCTCGPSIRYGTLNKVWNSWTLRTTVYLLSFCRGVVYNADIGVRKQQTATCGGGNSSTTVLSVWPFEKSSSWCICATVNKAAPLSADLCYGLLTPIAACQSVVKLPSVLIGARILPQRSSGVRFVVRAGWVFSFEYYCLVPRSCPFSLGLGGRVTPASPFLRYSSGLRFDMPMSAQMLFSLKPRVLLVFGPGFI
jgi:hypothetical protein